MSHFITRPAYERYVLLAGIEGAPEGERARLERETLDHHYPCGTGQAITELRARGYDVADHFIEYVIRAGKLPAPRTLGRDRAWTRDDIDRLADLLAESDAMTPAAASRLHYGLSGDYYLQSRYEAENRFGLGVEFSETIHPDGTVEFNPCWKR